MDMLRQPHQPVSRFMADAMLGRLARWLRMLGYDTAYERVISDEGWSQLVLSENRWLLTRDGYLIQRKVLRGRHILMSNDDLDRQLCQLSREGKIDLDLSHQRVSRCADCNTVLVPILPEQATPLVPPFVARRYQEFLQCPSCRRAFWPGTHWENLRSRIAAIRARAQSQPPESGEEMR
jgi:uncharacterized protein with PIN domain